ncbi:MAG TPA: ABC transporter permease [Terriglobales bacterium]|nr:ABC transporter permease [Terriglobales bacterium]
MKAARYFERRLVHSGMLLLAISLLVFGISQLAPGSFLDELKLNAQISSQTTEALRVQYGLDQPLRVRYFRWLKSAVGGNFGYSLAYNLPVSKLLWSRTRNTLLLGSSAMLLGWFVALPLGVWSAYKPSGWHDRLSTGISIVLLGTPELALGLLFILVAARFGNFPVGGMTSAVQNNIVGMTGDVLHHLIIPAAVLALASAPILFRHTRAAMLEAWNSPFVTAARGHGIGDLRLLVCHALPTALNPLISLFGLSLAALFSGSFLVEVICGWPGLGPLFLEAIYTRDFQVVVAVVMLFSVFLMVSTLLADLLLYAADPRVRAEC